MPVTSSLLCIGTLGLAIRAETENFNQELQHVSQEGSQKGSQEAKSIDAETAKALLKGIEAENNCYSNVTSIVKCVKGEAAYVAKTAALLQQNVIFWGNAGDDDLSAIAENKLQNYGIKTHIKKSGLTSLHFEIAQSTNLRKIFFAGETFSHLPEEPLPEDLLSRSACIMLESTLLKNPLTIQRILQHAAHFGIPVGLDVGSVLQVREHTEAILQYSRNYPLIIFMNADEVIAFYHNIRKTLDGNVLRDKQNLKEKETFILKDVCHALKFITGGEIFPIIVIKLGNRGSIVLAGGIMYHAKTFVAMSSMSSGSSMPSSGEKPKTCSAFNAAFLCAWMQEKHIKKCAAFANKVAKKCITLPMFQNTNENEKDIHKAKGLLKPFAKYLSNKTNK
jgi:sugar/nucleoside kinase (ribokinase family)